MQPQDRRRAPRVHVAFPAHAYIENEPYSILVRNVSRTGIYFQRLSGPAYEEGTLFLELRLPGEYDKVWATGVVVRREDPEGVADGTAITFASMSKADRERIERFLARRAGD